MELKEFIKKIGKLPQNVKDFVLSEKISDAMHKIAEEFNIPIKELSDIVHKVIFGELDVQNFYNELKNRFNNLSEEEVDKLEMSCRINFFSPIQSYLNALYNKNDDDSGGQHKQKPKDIAY